jgi:hypothetical protein
MATGEKVKNLSSDATLHKQDSFNPQSDDSLRAIFQRHFEAQFKPLEDADKRPPTKRPRKAEIQPEKASDDESEWSGISDSGGWSRLLHGLIITPLLTRGETEQNVKVVSFDRPAKRTEKAPKDERKAFMV